MRINLLIIFLIIFGTLIGVSCAPSLPGPDDNVSYSRAIKSGNVGFIKTFISRFDKKVLDDLDLLGHHFNPIEYALAQKQIDVANLLLNSGANPNAISNETKNPILFMAIEQQSLSTVKLLIEKKVDLLVRDANGLSSLEFAASKGNFELVKLVCEANNKTLEDTEFSNPLFGAIFSGNIETVKYLIEKGVNLEKKDKSSSTPLMWAIRGRKKEIAEILVKNSAKIDNKNDDGLTAKMLAEQMAFPVKGVWPK